MREDEERAARSRAEKARRARPRALLGRRERWPAARRPARRTRRSPRTRSQTPRRRSRRSARGHARGARRAKPRRAQPLQRGRAHGAAARDRGADPRQALATAATGDLGRRLLDQITVAAGLRGGARRGARRRSRRLDRTPPPRPTGPIRARATAIPPLPGGRAAARRMSSQAPAALQRRLRQIGVVERPRASGCAPL